MAKAFKLLVFIGDTFLYKNKHSISICILDVESIRIPNYLGKECISFSALEVFVADLHDFYLTCIDKEVYDRFEISCIFNDKKKSKLFTYEDFMKFIDVIKEIRDYSKIQKMNFGDVIKEN